MTEPLSGDSCDFLKRPWFLKKMCRTRNDDQFLRRIAESCQGLPVQLNNVFVIPADNQECGSANQAECFTREIRPASSGDNCRDRFPKLCRSYECCPRASAGAEVPYLEPVSARILHDPTGRADQSFREQLDIEAKLRGSLILDFFVTRQQVEQQGCNPF